MLSFFVLFLAGLGTGFAMWGNRVDHLTSSLNRMILEDETLRARLARTISEQQASADGGTVLSAVSLLSTELRMQAEMIDQQSRAIEQLAGNKEKELRASLSECSAVGSRLEKQLESCLFAKTRFERAPAYEPESEPEPAAGRHRSGKPTVSRTITLPEEVLERARR